jgi:hypothetical protein
MMPDPERIASCFARFASIAAAALLPLVFQSALGVRLAGAVEMANLDVVQHDAGNNTTSVTVTALQATSGFSVRTGSNRGDYNIQIGPVYTDDAAAGILITSVRENGRDNSAYGDPAGTFFVTSTSDRDAGAGYFIPLHTSPGGGEFNTNVAAAYFPFAEGWTAGAAYNSTNGGAITSLVASPGLTLGTHFVDHSSGTFELYLPGVDARTDGILLVNGAKNEDNYALSAPSADGTHFRIGVHDNGADGAGTEQDPVAFAYIPRGTENVVFGRINGNGGATLSQGEFTIRPAGTGLYRLSIAGQSPTSGTLIVSPEGFVSSNADNIVTYRADGNDWLILTQDLPGPSAQGVGGEGSFSFAFLPQAPPPTAPGSMSTFNASAIGAANVKVTEFNGGNSAGDMYALVTEGSAGIGIYDNNRGDVTISRLGAAPTTAQGVLLTTIREHYRNNSATGGISDYGMVATYNGNVIATHQTGTASNEQNVDFAVAFFPNEAGFSMGNNFVTRGATTLTVAGSGDTRRSGVLLANVFANQDDYVVASPNAEGSGWNVYTQDNASSNSSQPINYVFMPYGTENLVAGVMSDRGYLQSKSGGFTLVREGTGLYRLSIPGQSAQTGMLLLTALVTGVSGDYSSDNTLVYRADGDDFLIQGLDMGNASGSAQDTSFQFAFIGFDNPPANPQLRPFDPTAIQSGNIGVIQRDAGNNATSVSAYVESGTDALTIGAGNKGDFYVYVNGANVNAADGVMIATVRNNGRDNQDGSGTVYPFAGVGSDAQGQAWISVNRVMGGAFGLSEETNVDLAVAAFPFAGGYMGGHFTGSGTAVASTLPAGSTVTHTATGRWTLSIPGVDSRTDGALFTVCADDADNTMVASVLPDGSGWSIGTYDNQANLGEFIQDQNFSVLYLPFEFNPHVPALGAVDADGNLLASQVTHGPIRVEHLGTGQYLLDLGELTPDDGVLLLSIAGLENGMPADNVISYEALGGDFLIETRDMPGYIPALEDAAFAFAFVSFDAVMPEPASATLCAMGAVLLLLIAPRRRGTCGPRG